MKKAKYDTRRQARRQRALDRYTVKAPPAKVNAEYELYKQRKDEEHASLVARLARA